MFRYSYVDCPECGGLVAVNQAAGESGASALARHAIRKRCRLREVPKGLRSAYDVRRRLEVDLMHLERRGTFDRDTLRLSFGDLFRYILTPELERLALRGLSLSSSSGSGEDLLELASVICQILDKLPQTLEKRDLRERWRRFTSNHPIGFAIVLMFSFAPVLVGLGFAVARGDWLYLLYSLPFQFGWGLFWGSDAF